MSIKVADLNTEEPKELPPIEEEEITNQVVEQTNEEVKQVVNNEEVKEETPLPEAIEEAPEEEQPLEIANDVVEENANEEPTPKPEPKAKARPKQLSQSESSYGHRPKPNDLVLRYSHKCSTEPPPVKKQANPKPTAKQTAKPKPKQVPKPLVMIMTAKIMHHNNH